jgi:hypothetical protein
MPRTARAPYSVSYLFPAPDKVVTVSDKGHSHAAYPAEYLARVQRVFDGLHSPRARAAFRAQHYQIIGHHDELEGISAGNAPPIWSDKTLTATEVDGTVIERFVLNPDTAGEA